MSGPERTVGQHDRGPRIRPALRDIPTYKPGRPAAGGDRPAYKLSSNETPFPPLPELVAAVERAAGGMNRYPDLVTGRLAGALAERHGVAENRVAVGVGSVGLLYHLLQATCEPGDEVVYAWRSFEAYPIATRVTGAGDRRVPLRPDATHDLAAMADAVTDRTRAVMVCTPNNPTGPVVRRDDLRRFCDRVPDDVLVVMDEAYREFIRDPEAADGLELIDRPNVAVLRTFSKAYGLAGLRVGYLVADERVVTAVRACALPFEVSVVAEEAALVALGCEDRLRPRTDAIVAERERVASGLRTAGFAVPASEANFVWLPLGPRTEAFAAACEDAGVVVRPFPGDGCRVTVGEPEANDILLAVARSAAAG